MMRSTNLLLTFCCAAALSASCNGKRGGDDCPEGAGYGGEPNGGGPGSASGAAGGLGGANAGGTSAVGGDASDGGTSEAGGGASNGGTASGGAHNGGAPNGGAPSGGAASGGSTAAGGTGTGGTGTGGTGTGTGGEFEYLWDIPEVPPELQTVVTDERILNLEASVPPQCYTKTLGSHNPCFTCHQSYDRRITDRLNELDDGPLQGEYSFSDVGETNHYLNLFVDRNNWVQNIDDETILDYIDYDNYSPVIERLRADGFQGFIPDLENYAHAAAAFDERGLAEDGSHWVAYNYKPFPGTFWPTNGSTDDVLIRLPSQFRELDGVFDRDTYYVNLTLVELSIKQIESAPIWSIDETKLGVDIDKSGDLSTATSVHLGEHYVGDARATPIDFQQFPAGAELMHSVRYVGVDEDDGIVPATRMKELRYMLKVSALSRSTISSRYANERKEKFLGLLPNFIDRGDWGFDNGLGWFIKGFIEDERGELRPQTFEEDTFCMGCHTSIGTTLDSTFSLARKITGQPGWGYINLKGMVDAPSISESGGEIANYLRRNGGGSEFRENAEMAERWYLPSGELDEDAVAAADVYTLIAPSRERALLLNKAYTHIVRHQSYILGRDATVDPAQNVYTVIDESVPPLEMEYRYLGWDLRLDW